MTIADQKENNSRTTSILCSIGQDHRGTDPGRNGHQVTIRVSLGDYKSQNRLTFEPTDCPHFVESGRALCKKGCNCPFSFDWPQVTQNPNWEMPDQKIIVLFRQALGMS